MRRSQAPSILGAKASTSGVGGFNSPMLNKNKRSCRETSEKSLNVLQDRPDKMSFSEHESLIRSLLSKPFRVPLVDYVADCFMTKTLGMKKAAMKRAMHDPEMANALILYEPPFLSETAKLKVDPKDVLVHVVVDPVLGNILRPHQREGVKFMYDCLTGAKGGFKGCIMADEMGLGKTLQCITVVWTLLRQGPNCKPTINKAIIVCPSSLVKNWSSEFKKWLGFRINVLPIDGGGKEVITEKLVQFMAGHGRMGTPVLIISYETFRLYAQILHRSEVGMVLCDEGHRLKNCENQTYQALMGLKTDRRILISGTPIQNDLTEYFSLINFVNPGMLGSINEFRRLYENPILRGQDAGATDKEAEICEQSIIQLTTLVKQCMIRRTNTILTKYLPMKFEMIICVRMSGLQEELYENYLRSDVVKKSMKEMGNQSSVNLNVLGSIISLKKLCSHPDLVMDKIQERSDGFENAHKIMPAGYSTKDFHPEYGSKVMLLDVMLASIKANTDDKVVFISNYTGTLDFIQKLCVKRGYGYIRLDGSITIKNRLKLVDEFNATDQSKFLFLLSSKAGGCGLNLIGANRLIMFDPDWNPANDDQAMARVWRDGQKKTCYIYRMLVTGSIEEKIFQRQTQKKMLSNSVVDNEEDVSYHFSRNDLKELFLYEKGILSDTHNKIKCKRCVRNIQTEPPPPDTDCTSEIAQWYHSSVNKDLPDKVLSQAWNVLKPNISFIFHHHSSTKYKDESSMKQEIEKTVEQLSQNSQKLRNYESDYEDECDEYDKDFVP